MDEINPQPDPSAGGVSSGTAAAPEGKCRRFLKQCWDRPGFRKVIRSPWRLGVIVAWGILLTWIVYHVRQAAGFPNFATIICFPAGLCAGFLVATIDLHSDSAHRWLFIVQLPFLATIPITVIGLSVGLLLIIDTAVLVAEGPMLDLSRGADGYARDRVVAIIPERFVGKRAVVADVIRFGRVIGKDFSDVFRMAAVSAAVDGRLELSNRIAARCGMASVVAGLRDETHLPVSGRAAGTTSSGKQSLRAALHEEKPGSTPQRAVDVLALAVVAHRRGDTVTARSLIKDAAELPAGNEWSFAEVGAAQWASRQLLYARDLMQAYPDLVEAITRASASSPAGDAK